jgi:hypothetical protein
MYDRFMQDELCTLYTRIPTSAAAYIINLGALYFSPGGVFPALHSYAFAPSSMQVALLSARHSYLLDLIVGEAKILLQYLHIRPSCGYHLLDGQNGNLAYFEF